MKMIQSGDPAPLALLFERHSRPVFRYLIRVTRNRALSEDLTQEVFLRALRYATTYDLKLNARTWLLTMARNACHDARHRVRGETNGAAMSDFQSLEPLVEKEIEKIKTIGCLKWRLDACPMTNVKFLS